MTSNMSAYRLLPLRRLSLIPIVNGLGEAGDESNPTEWPRYIRTTDIAGTKVLDPDKRVTLALEVATNAPVLRNDILMCAAGATIGKSYIHLIDEPACYAGYLVRWRVNPCIADPRFMAYWTESDHFLAQVTSGAVKSTIENFSASRYRAILAPVPPISDQQRIADFLDRETAEIDDFIADQERLIELLEERRAATVSAEIASHMGRGVTPLKMCAQVKTGLTLGKVYEETTPEWPYLRVANVQVGRVDTNDVAMVSVPDGVARSCMLQTGDVLMTEGGDLDKLGRGAIWDGRIDPCLHQNHIFAVRCEESLIGDYLVYVLESQIARTYFETTGKQTTNLASTNSTIVKNFGFPLPTLAEQAATVNRLNQRIAQIDSTIGDARRAIELSRERRAALITAAVTGQIDVTTGRTRSVSGACQTGALTKQRDSHGD